MVVCRPSSLLPSLLLFLLPAFLLLLFVFFGAGAGGGGTLGGMEGDVSSSIQALMLMRVGADELGVA